MLPRSLGPAGLVISSAEFDLYPADLTGDSFVCRSHDDEPWSAVSFGRLADQTPYLYSGGRVILRVG